MELHSSGLLQWIICGLTRPKPLLPQAKNLSSRLMFNVTRQFLLFPTRVSALCFISWDAFLRMMTIRIRNSSSVVTEFTAVTILSLSSSLFFLDPRQNICGTDVACLKLRRIVEWYLYEEGSVKIPTCRVLVMLISFNRVSEIVRILKPFYAVNKMSLNK